MNINRISKLYFAIFWTCSGVRLIDKHPAIGMLILAAGLLATFLYDNEKK